MLSLCMIVRDEEPVLKRCLESASELVDEIVIVDTGSRDLTREIALSFTDKVYDFVWCDDFSAARNFAFSKASGDYLMWLDADDVIEGENVRLFRDIISKLDIDRPDVVMLPYNVAFDEGDRVLLSYERERIVRANAGFWFVGEIHEAIPPRGRIIHGKAAVSHRKICENEPGRNLRIFEKLVASGQTLEPRMKYYYARELRSAGRLDDAAKYYALCAEDGSAWVENRISAYFELSGVLLELGRAEESESALLRVLSLGSPRADVCCELGRRFLERGDLSSAKFWYELAPRQFPQNLGGFVHSDYGGYIPFMQLCVIFDRLGDHAAAERFNDLAGQIRQSPEVLYNKEYFRRLRGGSTDSP